MGKINLSRVILGGIVAAIVANVLGYLADGLILASQWSAAMSALGKGAFTTSQIIGFNITGLVMGIFTVWLYAAIRPRYGAGPKTAICAGVAVWVAATLVPNVSMMGIMGLFPNDLTIMTTVAGIIEAVAAALAGAAVYKEAADTAQPIAHSARA
jgi:hypothetical protein